MLHSVYKITGIAAAALLLSACGGTGSSEWGVDNSNALPTCNNEDSNDASASIKIPDGTVIKKTVDNTAIRVWHYANGDKYVCTISGNAVITATN